MIKSRGSVSVSVARENFSYRTFKLNTRYVRAISSNGGQQNSRLCKAAIEYT